jgi:hypothetical protein
LLSDALNFIITMSYKVKEIGIVMDGWWFGVVIELSMLAFNIKKKVCGVLDFFLSFLKSYENKKIQNMLSLMLDPQFKTFHLVFFILFAMNKACRLLKNMICFWNVIIIYILWQIVKLDL